MEVRTTKTPAAVGEVRPQIPLQTAEEPEDRLSRVAATAAMALGVPLACIYLEEDPGRRVGYGLRDDGLDEFLATIDLNAARAGPIVIGPEQPAQGGDGAVIRSFAAVPLTGCAEISGFFCAADYRERRFERSELALIDQFASLVDAELRLQSETRTLRRSEQCFRAVAENGLDTVSIIDRDGNFRYLSDSAEAVIGVDAEAGVGANVFDGIVKEDRSALRVGLAEASAEGDVVDVEVRFAHPKNGLRYLRLCGRNLIARPGVEGYLVHIRDATDRVEFEEELRRWRDRAEEMSRLKSVFLTNMSHEIRTPLTTILGFAEILASEVGEGKREFVHMIQQGGHRLLDTLLSILDLARLESRSFQIELEEVDVGRKVWETCLLFEPLAQEKGIYLNVRRPDEPVWALLDISAVERVVSNLVSNGIKFTSEGSVTLTVDADEEYVFIHVVDTGIGISDAFMPLLFEEFKQESEGLSRVHEGSGLGLTITKRLVELMNGNIMADSEKGRGAVFTVALPRGGKPAGKADGASADEAARARVLVVEDNADTRTLVNHLLRKHYDVICVSDGEEAVALAAESRFDALLVDINLGRGKSGEDVLHDVKAIPGYEQTPILAVTAYAMPGDRERFFSEGFDDYVSKPFSKQRLLEALEVVLE